ncbi:hypothetical protein C5167_001602 [Papaver somniferum]|uniref:Uncharacterized protein n=1 Tax=Papaver somniferum TaxID=3469 RepID=A0A4Y7KVS4_PAPSO|nr:hypothetical protein C5167_001602 [Papaver somniferum]
MRMRRNLIQERVQLKHQQQDTLKSVFYAHCRLRNEGAQVENKFVLLTKMSVEGPLRMKEEYVEGVLEMPTVSEEAIPDQIKGSLGQAVTTMQQLSVPIKDVLANGLKVPLSKHFDFRLMYPFVTNTNNPQQPSEIT